MPVVFRTPAKFGEKVPTDGNFKNPHIEAGNLSSDKSNCPVDACRPSSKRFKGLSVKLTRFRLILKFGWRSLLRE